MTLKMQFSARIQFLRDRGLKLDVQEKCRYFVESNLDRLYKDTALRHKFSQRDGRGRCKGIETLQCSEKYREQQIFSINLQAYIEDLLI